MRGRDPVFQAPIQGIAKCGEMPIALLQIARKDEARMADDGLKYLALIERPDDGGDHVHELKLLHLDIVEKQPSRRVGHEFEDRY